MDDIFSMFGDIFGGRGGGFGEASEGLADLAVAVHSNAGIAAVTFV